MDSPVLDAEENGFPAPDIYRQNNGEYFAIKAQYPLPVNVQPIVDDTTSLCIGYSELYSPGLWRIYDCDGRFITMEEAPLEAGFGPLEFSILTLGSFRLLSAGRSLFDLTIKAQPGITLSQGVQNLLRGRFKTGLSPSDIKFTRTTIERMKSPGRFIPVQIIEKAIRYGSRRPDTKGIEGLFEYRVPMVRLVRRIRNNRVVYERKEFTLSVVVREKDWTVMHFHIE